MLLACAADGARVQHHTTESVRFAALWLFANLSTRAHPDAQAPAAADTVVAVVGAVPTLVRTCESLATNDSSVEVRDRARFVAYLLSRPRAS